MCFFFFKKKIFFFGVLDKTLGQLVGADVTLVSVFLCGSLAF